LPLHDEFICARVPGGSVLLSDMFLNLHETKDPQSRQMPHVMVGLGAGKKNVEILALGCCTDVLRSLTCFIVCDATMPPRFR